MKTHIKNLFLLPALAAGLGLILAGQATAQTFTTLYSFTGGSDGAQPLAGLILSSNILYGTASGGVNPGKGTVFALSTDGTGFTTLYSFTGGSDGASPVGDLILSGNTLYGTASSAYSSANGTLFAVNTDGTGFTTVYSFTAGSGPHYGVTNSDGATPYAPLILSGNTLYGTAFSGGSSGDGTVFAVNTDGTGLTTLHSFSGGSDGANPRAGMILSGNTLYGTADAGGGSGKGTVFAVNTNGTGFTTVYSFTALNNNTNSDGSQPVAGLILSGNTLYGTALHGGSSGDGTVFKLDTDGTGFTILHSFTGGSDGAEPFAGLILSGNTLYGTARFGGSSGNGTVFAVNTDGTGFTTLYSFSQLKPNPLGGVGINDDGALPYGELILSGNALYGTAYEGGSSGYGTLFSLSLPPVSSPQLTLLPSGPYVILTWPTNATGFTLQSTTNLVSPAVWTTVSPGPVVVNGQNAVTNLISGAQQFFRLSQ